MNLSISIICASYYCVVAIKGQLEINIFFVTKVMLYTSNPQTLNKRESLTFGAMPWWHADVVAQVTYPYFFMSFFIWPASNKMRKRGNLLIIGFIFSYFFDMKCRKVILNGCDAFLMYFLSDFFHAISQNNSLEEKTEF